MTQAGPAAGAALAAVLALTSCAAPAASVPPPTAPLTSAAPTASATPTATPTPPTSTPSTLTPTTPTPTVSWQDGPTVTGVDVSRYNPEVDWQHLAATGHRFAYVKATEGTGHRSLTYDAQAAGARDAGLFVGGYHYARPGSSDGATQARFFAEHGGGWTADGHTLPGALDLEENTAGDACYGLTPAQLRAWVEDFSGAYAAATGRFPVIYVKAVTWRTCLGDAPAARPGQHLWLYDHGDAPGELPPGWEQPTFWQRAIEDGLDRNVFYGTVADLARLAVDPHS